MIRSTIGKLLGVIARGAATTGERAGPLGRVLDAALDRLGEPRGRQEASSTRSSLAPGGSPPEGGPVTRQPVGADSSGTPPGPPEKPTVPARVVRPRPIEHRPAAPESDALRVLAHPSSDNRQCSFELGVEVLPGLSWRFADAASAAASPFGRSLFEHPEVAWVEVHGAVVRVARRSGKEGDWRPLAAALGSVLRRAASEPVIPPGTPLPDSEALERVVRTMIEDEVNPGLAAHSGNVTLRRVDGNTLYLEMGGGCQGCSAAALTLKVGIYNAFRAAVPGLGVIYDLTDHAAGTAPYLS